MKPDETLIVDKLSKRYSLSGGRFVQALDEASFATQAGTVLGIVGANGAGKSTLLKVLARVTLPSAGELKAGRLFTPQYYGRSRNA